MNKQLKNELFEGEHKIDRLVSRLEKNPVVLYYQGISAALDGEHTLNEINKMPDNAYKLAVKHILTNQIPDNLSF